jgi:DNA invertase Pin-like site-specific DNA recombinase
MIVIVAAISELERSLIVERVRAGMRRAKLEGRQIGRARLDINREHADGTIHRVVDVFIRLVIKLAAILLGQ